MQEMEKTGNPMLARLWRNGVPSHIAVSTGATTWGNHFTVSKAL